jgi:Sulfotransferase family
VSLDHLRPYLDREGVCRNPVFIIGSPRSGTSALAQALGRHPALWVSRESYVLHQLYGEGRAARTWKHHWERVTPSWLRAEEVDRAEFLGFLGLGINAMYSSRSGGRRWIDPTPLNTPMVHDLADMFPSASFVHIVRDGRAVVRSMGAFFEMLKGQHGTVPRNEVPPWVGDFRMQCKEWAKYTEAAFGFEDARPARCVTVRNEELAADPPAGFARIHRFLEVQDDDGPATTFAGPRVNSSFRGNAQSQGDAGWDEWGAELRRTFAEEAGDTLVRAGYASSEELKTWVASGPVASPVPHEARRA